MRWAKIESIERVRIAEPVFNLAVMEDNSYVVNGVVVHNCGHSLAPFIPELTDSDELNRLREASNRPFDDDPRTRAEVEAYERSQRINALRRERQRLLAQREADVVPLDARMRRWAAELQRPDLTPERRRELEEKLGARAERWEEGRRARLREVNAELRRLNREQREAIREQHKRLSSRLSRRLS